VCVPWALPLFPISLSFYLFLFFFFLFFASYKREGGRERESRQSAWFQLLLPKHLHILFLILTPPTPRWIFFVYTYFSGCPAAVVWLANRNWTSMWTEEKKQLPIKLINTWTVSPSCRSHWTFDAIKRDSTWLVEDC
jgi:hypothetical protein